MQLIRGNSYYYPSQVVIGGYKVDDQLVLIDSGNDDSSIRKAIRDFGDIKVIALFNTHSHADHCGGNAYIARQFNPLIYAPELENSFIESPILEPTYLYGAYPMQLLQNKFLMAKPSKVTHAFAACDPIDIQFKEGIHQFKPLSLAGHSPNQYGYLTPDGIAYLGDALISTEMVSKHPLIFTYDVTAHLSSLNSLESLHANGYVIAHGGYFDDIKSVIASNRTAMMTTLNHIITEVSKDPCTFDQLHESLGIIYNLTENVPQNLLNRSVIHAHVRHLVDLGELSVSVEKGRLLITK